MDFGSLLPIAKVTDTSIRKYVEHTYFFTDRILNLDMGAGRALKRLQSLSRRFGAEPGIYTELATKAVLADSRGVFHPLRVCSLKVYADIRWGSPQELYFAGDSAELSGKRLAVSISGTLIQVITSLKVWEENHYPELLRLRTERNVAGFPLDIFRAYVVVHRGVLHPALLYDLNFIREYWSEVGNSFAYLTLHAASVEHSKLFNGGAQNQLKQTAAYTHWQLLFGSASLFVERKVL